MKLLPRQKENPRSSRSHRNLKIKTIEMLQFKLQIAICFKHSNIIFRYKEFVSNNITTIFTKEH